GIRSRALCLVQMAIDRQAHRPASEHRQYDEYQGEKDGAQPCARIGKVLEPCARILQIANVLCQIANVEKIGYVLCVSHILPWRTMAMSSQKPIMPATMYPTTPGTEMSCHIGGTFACTINEEAMMRDDRT